MTQPEAVAPTSDQAMDEQPGLRVNSKSCYNSHNLHIAGSDQAASGTMRMAHAYNTCKTILYNTGRACAYNAWHQPWQWLDQMYISVHADVGTQETKMSTQRAQAN